MGISLNNTAPLKLHNNLNINTNQLNDNVKKISSGLKFPEAKDNPSAYEILVRMSSQIKTLDQSNQNTQTGNALLSTANGAIGSTVDSLSSLKERLVQAANGTNNAGDLKTIQDEINQTVSQLDDNANVSFNGKNLIDGSLSGKNALQIAGTDGNKQIAIGDMSAEGLGLTSGGASNINLSTPGGITNAMDLVDTALESALSEQAKIGASQNALSYSSNNYTTASENLTGAASTMGDTNIAKEMLDFTKNRTLEKMTTFMLSQSNQSNFNVLGLLR